MRKESNTASLSTECAFDLRLQTLNLNSTEFRNRATFPVKLRR